MAAMIAFLPKECALTTGRLAVAPRGRTASVASIVEILIRAQLLQNHIQNHTTPVCAVSCTFDQSGELTDMDAECGMTKTVLPERILSTIRDDNSDCAAGASASENIPW
jgi:hypothetical protein